MDKDKPKEQLLNELEEMRQRIKELEASETERKRAEHDLAERVKELQCLYSIARIAERPRVTLDKLYQEVANLLPGAWQYPEITCARVTIGNKGFETENWKETEWKQSSDVKVRGVKAGAVEVCYLEERPPIGEGPFFEEERQLIDVVAERLGEITERKRLEEALRESEEQFKQFFDNEPNYCYMVSPDGTILDVNKAARNVLGYNKEQLVGKPLRTIYAPESLPKMKQLFEKWQKTGTLTDEEMTIIARDGNRRTVLLSADSVKNSDGKILHSASVQKDITERKQLEEVQRKHVAAQARAEEVQQSRQRIIAMQESLRKNIAQQIHGAVQNRLIIMMHRLANLERSSRSEEMSAEVADLHQELKDVLEDYIRPISHRLFPSILRRGLVPALQSLVDQFETAQSIDMELSEELKRQERINPKFIIEQTRLTVYRIAEEALVNATKHAKASRITVKLEPSSEGWLRLTVRDDGRGFDIESASAGLGILMMQDYAEVVGGSCVINSAPGKGTEITATVPLAEPGAEYPQRA